MGISYNFVQSHAIEAKMCLFQKFCNLPLAPRSSNVCTREKSEKPRELRSTMQYDVLHTECMSIIFSKDLKHIKLCVTVRVVAATLLHRCFI